MVSDWLWEIESDSPRSVVGEVFRLDLFNYLRFFLKHTCPTQPYSQTSKVQCCQSKSAAQTTRETKSSCAKSVSRQVTVSGSCEWLRGGTWPKVATCGYLREILGLVRFTSGTWTSNESSRANSGPTQKEYLRARFGFGTDAGCVSARWRLSWLTNWLVLCAIYDGAV